MKKYFDLIKSRFILRETDLTKYIEYIYSSQNTEGKYKVGENEELSFKKENDKIILNFNGETYSIDNKPFSFYNEKDELLFKIYNKSDSTNIDETINTISNDYDFYDINDNIINKEILFEKGENKIILKLKNKEFEDLFKPLFNQINISKESEVINTKILLPYEPNILGFQFNSDFELIIKERIELVNKIYEYLKNDNISIIKIYGSDGIGKSISYLFFASLKDTYKKIYFNLKDIFKYPCDIQDYFVKSLMKYYCNFNNNEMTNNEITEKKISLNYSYYIDHKNLVEKEKIDNFWEMLNTFCERIEIYSNSVIIIDQYKREYDEKGRLNTILKHCLNKRKIKFIISSSLNDNSVKEDFILNLRYFNSQSTTKKAKDKNGKGMSQIKIEKKDEQKNEEKEAEKIMEVEENKNEKKMEEKEEKEINIVQKEEIKGLIFDEKYKNIKEKKKEEIIIEDAKKRRKKERYESIERKKIEAKS